MNNLELIINAIYKKRAEWARWIDSEMHNFRKSDGPLTYWQRYDIILERKGSKKFARELQALYWSI